MHNIEALQALINAKIIPMSSTAPSTSASASVKYSTSDLLNFVKAASVAANCQKLEDILQSLLQQVNKSIDDINTKYTQDNGGWLQGAQQAISTGLFSFGIGQAIASKLDTQANREELITDLINLLRKIDPAFMNHENSVNIPGFDKLPAEVQQHVSSMVGVANNPHINEEELRGKCNECLTSLLRSGLKPDYIKYIFAIIGIGYELITQLQKGTGIGNRGVSDDIALFIASAVVTNYFSLTEEVKQTKGKLKEICTQAKNMSAQVIDDCTSSAANELDCNTKYMLDTLEQQTAIVDNAAPIDIIGYLQNFQKKIPDTLQFLSQIEEQLRTNTTASTTSKQQPNNDIAITIQAFQKHIASNLAYLELACLLNKVSNALLAREEKIKLLLRCSLLTRENILTLNSDSIHFLQTDNGTDVPISASLELKTKFKNETIPQLLAWITKVKQLLPATQNGVSLPPVAPQPPSSVPQLTRENLNKLTEGGLLAKFSPTVNSSNSKSPRPKANHV